MTKPPASFPLLETRRLVLRDVRDGDVDDLFRMLSDPRVVEFDNWQPMKKRSEADRVARWMASLWPKRAGVGWAILTGDGRFCGSIRYNWLNKRWRHGEIGYELLPEMWGKGIASEAVRAVIAFGHGPYGLHRIEAWTLPGNPASDRVLEKNGFAFEGLARGKAHFKGAYRDFRMFARIADDPFADTSAKEAP